MLLLAPPLPSGRARVQLAPMEFCMQPTSFPQIAERLRGAILADLGIASPPYYLKVMQDVGGVTVELFDTREQGGAYREGRYVSGHIIQPWNGDPQLRQHAKDAADAMRGHVAAYEKKVKEPKGAWSAGSPIE